MRYATQLLIKTIIAALFLVCALPASRPEVGARSSPSFLGTGGGPTFVDSGQALGSEASRDVAMGDVDGDGDLDALVVNGNATLALWLNEDGLFSRSDQDLGGYTGNAVALHDLDGDGDLDAVAVLNAVDDVLRVLINQGPQTPGVFLPSGQTVRGIFNEVAVGDLNGDGSPDLFLTIGGPGNQVWFSDGGSPPVFTDSGQRLGNAASQGAALGDLDGDGDLDAFVANTLFNGDASNTVWVNQGGMQAGTEGVFNNSGAGYGTTNTLAVALGDVNHDGDLDALEVNSGMDRLLLGGALSSFADSAQILDDELSTDGAIADLDADGDQDIFVVNIGGGNTVWINQGDGSFLDRGQRLGDALSYSVALGDVDGNGTIDAFVANNGPNRVWLNQGSVPGVGADVVVQLPPTRYVQSLPGACPPSSPSMDVTVRNDGPEVATNVSVHASQGTFGWPGSGGAYDIGTLLPGEAATLHLGELPAAPSATGTIHCTAAASVSVTADQDDPNLENNADQSDIVWYSCDELCSLETIFCEISPPTEGAYSLMQLAQDAALDLLVYFYVRDDVLAETQQGQHYVDLYEAHDAEIKGLLEADTALADEAINTLQLWEPNLWDLVRGKGSEATISAEQVTAVDNFLEHLSTLASPALQQTIAAERDRLPPPETFIGLTMDEARGMTVGFGLYLPVAQR